MAAARRGIRNRKELENMQEHASTFQKIDGKYVNSSAHRHRTIISKANAILRAQKYIEERDDSIYKTKKLASNLLFDLNCTQIPLGPGYSLVRSQTDKTEIGNPNIIDPLAARAKNKVIKTSDNFPNECDPFYTLDDQAPRQVTDERKALAMAQKPDLTMTAVCIAQVNFHKGTRVLKEFMDPQAIKRSNY